MNKNNIVRNPKFAIEPKLDMTVYNRFLNSIHERTILKILRSLKALNTDKPPPPSPVVEASSTKLITTTMLSKILKESDK